MDRIPGMHKHLFRTVAGWEILVNEGTGNDDEKNEQYQDDARGRTEEFAISMYCTH